MANGTAVRDASQTLVALLESNVDVDSLNVELSSPNVVAGATTPTLSVYLYKVTESEHLSSVDTHDRVHYVDADGDPETPETRAIDPTTLTRDPLVLDLHYLLTAYPPGSDGETRQVERQHLLLGKAMGVLRDHAIVRGSALKGSLSEELRITRSDSDDQVVDIWNTFPETAYLPSVTYEVGPVTIESAATEPAERVESVRFEGGGDDG